jgi:hypothetical protein
MVEFSGGSRGRGRDGGPGREVGGGGGRYPSAPPLLGQAPKSPQNKTGSGDRPHDGSMEEQMDNSSPPGPRYVDI